jgi:aerotolerance regulator-like protein
MSLLAPGFFVASLAVAAAIVALHFIVTRQPRAAMLPTARFVPDTRATTVARARRPSDLLLMLLRVLLVLAAGAGLAKPVLTARRGASARVIVVDVSRSARDSIATRDSVRALYRSGDAVVVFDSSARVVAANVGDTLGELRPTTRRGNLSAALIAALRAGSSLRDHADSLELVIVSPFAKEELDAATDSIRKLWPGKARLVRVGSSAASSADVPGTLVISADTNDPLRVTAALAQLRTTENGKRESENEKLATGTGDGRREGGPLIEWPSTTRPRFSVQRTVRDTVGGVMSGDAVVVAAFDRQWMFPPDSLRGTDVIARWVDGEPAAIEKPAGARCVRSVAIPVTPVGDLVIRKDFVRFVASLSRPCSGITSLIPADPAVVAKLEGTGGLAPREAFQPVTDARSELATWLFALAIAAAIGELFARRRVRAATTHVERRSTPAEVRAA